jgi:hypothetical protein
MRRKMTCALVLVVLGGFVALAVTSHGEEAKGKGQLLSHDVYFTLKDNSGDAKQKLVTACKKYLSKHDGEVFFAAGVLAKALNRPVNDRDFDVALHIVFTDQAAQDKYQDAPRHKQFIDENKDNWKKVRVFDSVVTR